MSNSVGEQLRTAREASAWSVEEIAARLKIPARYVAALEAGDDAVLPGPTFVRGYIKAYAKTVGLDADALLASAVPLDVRAPRPLIGPEGQASASRRAGTRARLPSFRSPVRRLPLVGVALAAGVAVVWFFAARPSDAPSVAASVTAPAPVTPPAVPAAVVPVAPVAGGGSATGAVTLPVPLPGTVQPQSQTPAASPAPVGAVAAAVATPAGGLTAAPATTASAAAPSTAMAAADSGTAPTAPRKGLHARFSGTCWVEVRDADNVVIHTRIAMAGNELNLDGKAPLTVTLGDASAAELWYNGERVTADRFSSNGIARIIVGQAPR